MKSSNPIAFNDCQSYGEAIVAKMLEKSSVAPGEVDNWKAIANELNRDMWAILCAKAEAEAEEKMDGCNQGEGLWAYLRIHLWFTRTTAQGRSLRRAGIMNPTRCKHEHEISAAIEKWEERYRTLQKDDRELDLPDSWKMTAIQGILCGEIQKNVEYREKDFKTYEELRSTVMKWAINKKTERDRSTRGEPMDTNQAEEQSSCNGDWIWSDQKVQSGAESSYEIDYAGGTGKGPCHNCNQMGHQAWECSMPKKGKGKGKGWKGEGKGGGKSSKGSEGGGKGGKTGKGGMQSWNNPMQMMWTAIQAMKGGGKGKGGKGPCYRCGQSGHLIKDCPTWPVREVEEEEKSEIDWACMIDEEAHELNSAEE